MNAADPVMVAHQSILAMIYILWFTASFVVFMAAGLFVVSALGWFGDRLGETFFGKGSN